MVCGSACDAASWTSRSGTPASSAAVQLREVWGPSYETETNYLRVYLPQLRRKLEPELSRPKYLLTESGMGYRFKT